jgi:hypothetical protein
MFSLYSIFYRFCGTRVKVIPVYGHYKNTRFLAPFVTKLEYAQTQYAQSSPIEHQINRTMYGQSMCRSSLTPDFLVLTFTELKITQYITAGISCTERYTARIIDVENMAKIILPFK